MKTEHPIKLVGLLNCHLIEENKSQYQKIY